MEWGSASDGKRIYVQIANFYGLPNAGGNAGSWAALIPQRAPSFGRFPIPTALLPLAPWPWPMVSSMRLPWQAGDGADDARPGMQAMVRRFRASPGSSVNCGATIVNDVVYWGSGYTHLQIRVTRGTTNSTPSRRAENSNGFWQIRSMKATDLPVACRSTPTFTAQAHVGDITLAIRLYVIILVGMGVVGPASAQSHQGKALAAMGAGDIVLSSQLLKTGLYLITAAAATPCCASARMD
jgi:hypothetical protein